MGANVFHAGEMCGGCEIVGLLGSGGFAQVYEVIDPSGARRALKVLDTDAETRPKLRARLAQEGAALAMIEHVNVVRLYDAGFHEDRIYLVLELVRGKTLRDALRAEGGRPPPETLVRWIRQACDGVGEGHRVGVFHRDIKPENLLIAPQDLVKVIDFGIAKFSTWGVKTSHEQRLGTALYMSPEQIQGRPPDARMDVYALGLVLYEALSGQHPIVSGPATVFEICARQLNYLPKPLASIAPEVPPELGAVVDQAIEKDPERRLPSMRAFSEALHEGMRHLTGARTAAVNRILAGPGAQGVTRELEGAIATGGERSGTTERMPSSVVVRPPEHLVRTLPIGEAEVSSDAATAPIDTGAIATEATEVTGEAITVPVARVMAERSDDGARGRKRAARRVGVIVMAAAVIGVGGGVWLMTRLLAKSGAAATATTTTTGALLPNRARQQADLEDAVPATATATATAMATTNATAMATTNATATPGAMGGARVTRVAPRVPKPKATATAAPKLRAFPDYDGLL